MSKRYRKVKILGGRLRGGSWGRDGKGDALYRSRYAGEELDFGF